VRKTSVCARGLYAGFDMKLLNFCGVTCTFYRADGTPLVTVAPDGAPPIITYQLLPLAPGPYQIPLYLERIQAQSLPPFCAQTYLLVPPSVRRLLPQRTDLLSPGSLFRLADGTCGYYDLHANP